MAPPGAPHVDPDDAELVATLQPTMVDRVRDVAGDRMLLVYTGTEFVFTGEGGASAVAPSSSGSGVTVQPW